MQAPQAGGAVVPYPCAAFGHTCATVGAGEAFVPADGIEAYLRLSGPIQERPDQPSAVQVVHLPETATGSERLRRTAGLRIGIQRPAQCLDLASRAGLQEAGLQHFKVHGR